MIFHDWLATEIIPDPLAWYQYQYGGSAGEVIYDSVGTKHLTADVSNAPVLLTDIIGGQPAWYFDGTKDPLLWTGDVTIRHAFILASNDDATFDGFQGLLTGATTGDVLVGDDGTTKFFDLSIGNFYTKEAVDYIESNQQAPMQAFRLLEVHNATGITLDGIQVGQQRDLAGRYWKGHFAEMILFDRILTREEIRRVRLYFNVKFGEFKRGLPLYFPSADITPTVGPSRFYDVPADYKSITDEWEYEDGTKDRNAVADTAPMYWEYAYPQVPKAHLPIYNGFWDQVQLVNTFLFKDPDGVVWTNVSIDDYNRNHEAHKRWKHDVAFRLVGNNSVGTFEDDPTGPAVPTGLTLSLLSGTSLTASWDEPPDTTAPSVPVMTAATSITADSITWNWNASTDDTAVTGYDLQTAEDAGFTTGLVTHNLGNVLTYVDSPVSASTTYYARVRAHDIVPNNSAYSSSVNATTSAGLLLDNLGLTAKLAYGLRKLRAAYSGSCLRVRRASDNVEQDIGFSGDDLDWASAISFKGASTITVVLWYDQSGSAKNFDALADAREPLLNTSTEIITFDGSDDLLRASTVDLSAASAVSFLWAGKFNTLSGTDRAISIGSVNPLAELYSNSALIIAQQDGSNNKNTTADTTARVFTMIADRSQTGADDTKLYFSSTEQTTVGDSTNMTGNFASCDVGMAEKGGDPTGDISSYEFILFASALSAPNRATAVADMEAYYSL